MTFKLNFFSSTRSLAAKQKQKYSTFLLIASLLIVGVLTYILYIPQQKAITEHKLKVGDIVVENIIVNKDTTVEDKESTEKKRIEAKENVVPVYEYYAGNQVKTHDLLTRWFTEIRNLKKEFDEKTKDLEAIKEQIDIEFGLKFSLKEVRSLLNSAFFNNVKASELFPFIDSFYAGKVLRAIPRAPQSEAGTIKVVYDQGEPEVLQIESLFDLKKVETNLFQYIKERKLAANDRDSQLGASLIKDLMDVNIAYSKEKTQKEKQNAAAAVLPVMVKFKEGKVILRKGDEVKEGDLKILELIAYAEEIGEKKLPSFYLILVIMLFLALYGRKFFTAWQAGGINRDKIFAVTGATLIVSVLTYRVCLFLFPLILKNITLEIPYDSYSIFFAIPFGVGVLSMAFIFDLHSAVIFSFVNAVVSGIVCNWDFKIAIYVLLGNLAVSFGIEFYQRLKRSPIIKASILWMLPVNVAIISVFSLTEANLNPELLMVNVAMGFFSAILTPILANFIIPLWEIFFQLVTELKLIELTNLNLPIFREMLEKAPGTYHHSQMVASLSEAAALDLGHSPLLQTAMALYHDIGKIDNPHYFTENHSLYKNPHENLAPRESAKNIISHIPDGLERADKIKLPAVVRSAITQHHGSKMVRFFYDKAREMSSVDSDGFDDKAFRYQGEKPKSIENAILMLADQVEAASKSLASPTDEEIKNVIRRIIDNNIGENQFDDCEGLTFKALNIIANSFHRKLSSIYHMRISYPGFDFKEKAKEKIDVDTGEVKVI